MTTLRIRIESVEEVGRSVAAAMRGGRPEAEAGLSFPSYETMHRILSPKRLEIVKAMVGVGVVSIRQLARSVDRDFKGVHSDVTALVNAGVIDRVDGGIIFPYEAIHVEFDVPAAA